MQTQSKDLPLIKVIGNSQKFWTLLFFSAFLLVGILTYRDYGISWDEEMQRNTGMVTSQYVLGENTDLLTYIDRYYGTAFELVLIFAEKAFDLEDTHDIFLLRHLLTFLLFALGVFFFFLICKQHFGSWRWGLLGAAFLVLSPRIFAHAFYNSKDLAFLSVFIIAIYSLILFLQHPHWKTLIFHALTTAFLIDIRILGVLIPALTVCFYWNKRGIKDWAYLIGYGGFALFATVLFWPLLWNSPIQEFIAAFNKMSHYPWDGVVLYGGQFIKALDLPWHYLPVWMLITTPLVCIGFFILGLLLCFYAKKKQEVLIFTAWFFLPVMAVLILQSVVYDGWRQLFFVYPAMVLIALIAISVLWDKVKEGRFLRYAFIGIVALGLLEPFGFMVFNHPHQNVYFNAFSGNDLRNRFELDYWGLSFKQGLEKILEKDSSKVIPIYVEHWPGISNVSFLPKEDRSRFELVEDEADAKYFLTNYRWHSKDYDYEKWDSIKVKSTEILGIYKPT